MLIATWIITFVLIVGIGVYAGTKITNSGQWSGNDKSMGIFAVGAVLGAWQIGGMSIVGAAQNGYVMGIAGSWYSIANGLYILAWVYWPRLCAATSPATPFRTIWRTATPPEWPGCSPMCGLSSDWCTSPSS